MGSHLMRFVDIEFEVRISKRGNQLEVVAHEHLQGERLEELPQIDGEAELVSSIKTFLSKEHGPTI
jgi:hypothetical protein